jgi:hypothetical protein
MLQKAERNLNNILDLPTDEKETLKVVADVSKFTTSRLGKKKWSERTELTGADGKDLVVQPINYANTITTQVQSKTLPNTITESDGQRNEKSLDSLE